MPQKSACRKQHFHRIAAAQWGLGVHFDDGIKDKLNPVFALQHIIRNGDIFNAHLARKHLVRAITALVKLVGLNHRHANSFIPEL